MRFWSGGTRMKPMSGLYRNGLAAPTEATIFAEFGCVGQSSTTRFHGLSGGNTSRAEQMASASGVSNITGLVIAGILAERTRSTRAGSPATGFGGWAARATADATATTDRARTRMGTSKDLTPRPPSLRGKGENQSR